MNRIPALICALMCAPVCALAFIGAPAPAKAQTYKEPPYLAGRIAAGVLPSIAQRLPQIPAVADMSPAFRTPGRYGGTLRLLFGRAKDIRIMTVYGYARLAGYNHNFEIVPDILRDIDVTEGGRTFTLHLRPGHKWSDGHPFTAEDFRFYWEDIALNEEVSKAGPPRQLMADGKRPRFAVIDKHTVRYSWDEPNPLFLPALAQARPLYIYRPAHYMKHYHGSYQDPGTLKALVKLKSQRNWAALMLKYSRQYRNDNPEMPTLQPWVNTTAPPADRFIFKRNPYYHRVDGYGRQLPYIDEAAVTIASPKLIPAKAGAGEADLQARSIAFSDYTFLKEGAERNNFDVRLWRSAKASHMALYPNLNAKDETWRALFRNVKFRRALSIAVNRREINQVIYFGLAYESANTALPLSPLYTTLHAKRWTGFDLHAANRMLDELGLKKRGSGGVRLLPDGRPMEMIVETPGEDPQQADVLELIHDSWLAAGIKLYTKPLQREVFRNRIYSGATLMAVSSGWENGVPTAMTPPMEQIPSAQHQYQWPKWGQYFQTGGMAGEAPDLPAAQRLMELAQAWVDAPGAAAKRAAWDEMLKIHADQVFVIGLVNAVPQPVVVADNLRNVPEEGLYGWDPGARFGAYRPDLFWFDDAGGDPAVNE
ncbi:MAG: ABC transporter substrate-binding protein [Rhodospirillales bacterium]